MKETKIQSILLVCMGNICRSPTAEAVLRKVLQDAGLGEVVRVESAGTHAYHSGEPPDRRAQAAAHRRGFMLADIRARAVRDEDFADFDYILVMDNDNLEQLLARTPEEHRSKVRLFLEFAGTDGPLEVPDPYYGGPSGFEKVLDLVEQGARQLISRLRDLQR